MRGSPPALEDANQSASTPKTAVFPVSVSVMLVLALADTRSRLRAVSG